MKTAIYIEDGTLQLVLTPESEHEKSCMRIFNNKKVDAKLFDGSFYDCRGGWVRQTAHYNSRYGEQAEDNSLIIRVAANNPLTNE